MFKIHSFLILISLLSVSCKRKKETEIPVNTIDYCPISYNYTKEYQVFETRYTLLGKTDTTYLLKERVGEVLQGKADQESYKLLRLSKNINGAKYKLDSIWQIIKTEDKIIVVENNVSFLKLFKPYSEGKTWNGNLYNNYNEQLYKTVFVDQPWDKYPTTITILHKNDTNLLYRNLQKEIYAKDVGLVYKETKEVNYSRRAEDLGKGIIDNGIIKKQRLLNYAVEKPD